MSSHLNTAELARAVAHWLDEVRPQLDQRNAFLARVAMNALGVIDREVQQRDAATAAITPRLAKLLGTEGSYDSLIRELCACLRGGQMGVDTPELLAVLRDDTLANLAIDQPNYRHERSKE